MENSLGSKAVWLVLAAFLILLRTFPGIPIVPQADKHAVGRFGRLRSVPGRGPLLSAAQCTVSPESDRAAAASPRVGIAT